MNKLIRLGTFIGTILASALPLQAESIQTADKPDSVYLFSYSLGNGESGLRFAWSPDGKQWASIGNGFDYVKCDFGPWGSEKKMFSPHLMQNTADGSWHCIWTASRSGKVLAHSTSSNLLQWGAQTYFTEEEREQYTPSTFTPTEACTVTLGQNQEKGWIQRVPYSTIEQLVQYAEYKHSRFRLHDERMQDDSRRFADLKSVEASIQVFAAEEKPISDLLIGIFFEDINYAADGGLYAELIQNRDFEYSPKDGSWPRWDGSYAWSVKNEDSSGTVPIATENPIHVNNPHYAVLSVAEKGTSLRNTGFDGIALKKGEKYDFSLFARIADEGEGGNFIIRLITREGTEISQTSINITSKEWKKYTAVLTANADITTAELSLEPQTAGTYHLDMISLFPQNTFKGRKNGLRADLAQTLADLKPRFIRFPGGCVAHGDGIDNIYEWKGSVGPLEARKPLRNIWGYHQTRGLGYFEYFQFCEDIGAEPVPVLAAGVPCQNSGTPAHHSTDEISTKGQQRGIPMEEMPAYIQDILDLIEYANGDPVSTEWGKKRAQAGHPAPFNLKYIGIGNEDQISDVFEKRFTLIYNAVREKHPEITVIGTVGPFYEGTDYTEGWKLASKLSIPIVDEHYYVPPGWFIYNQDFYDHYDRNKSKVYLGEYAAHLPGRPNNIETALAEALYLTALERNADIVTMASYAPLLAKEGHIQWNPDLIYFNNTEVKPTVGYYTQQMYGQNSGDKYISSIVRLDNEQEAVKKRVGVSVVKDTETDSLIVKLVNLLPVDVNSQIEFQDTEFINPTAIKTLLTGSPQDWKAKPISSEFEVQTEGFSYAMPPYSFTVIRIHSQSETNS